MAGKIKVSSIKSVPKWKTVLAVKSNVRSGPEGKVRTGSN